MSGKSPKGKNLEYDSKQAELVDSNSSGARINLDALEEQTPTVVSFRVPDHSSPVMIELVERIRYLEELNRQQNDIIQSQGSEVYLSRPTVSAPPVMIKGNTARSQLVSQASVEDADEGDNLGQDQEDGGNTFPGVLGVLNFSPEIEDGASLQKSPTPTEERSDDDNSPLHGGNDDHHQSEDSSSDQEDASDSRTEKKVPTPASRSSSDIDEPLSNPSTSDQAAPESDAEPPSAANVFKFQDDANAQPSQALVKLSTPQERADARHTYFAKLPIEERKKMVKFHDCIDRKFSFLYYLVRSWEVSQVLQVYSRNTTNWKYRALRN